MPPPFSSGSRLYQEVVDSVQQQIFSGELRPGDRLPPERQLVREFGISRTAVREALRSLSAKGLVESQVGRGTFVRRPTPEQLALQFQMMLGERLRPEDLESAFYYALTAMAEMIVVRRTQMGGEVNADFDAALLEAGQQDSIHSAAFSESLAQAAPNAVLGTMLTVLGRLIDSDGNLPSGASIRPNQLVELLRSGGLSDVRNLFGDKVD